MRRLVPLPLALALALAVPAAAYMPPQAYISFRAAADYHVQLRVGGVSPTSAADGHGTCLVTGSVAAIFRDKPGRLRLDQSITVGIPCMMPGRNAPPVAGGTAWHDFDRLRAVKVLELFLNRGESGFAVADYGDRVDYLDAPTTAPRIVDRPQR